MIIDLKIQITLGGIIKHFRIKNKLSQEGLAKLLNVNRMTVVKWEKDISEPKFSQFKQLVKILQLQSDLINMMLGIFSDELPNKFLNIGGLQ